MNAPHSDETLHELIDLAFSCVTAPEQWQAFLKRLMEVTESDRAVLHNHWEVNGDSGGVISLGMDERAQQEHRQYFWQVVPWREHAQRLPEIPVLVFPHRHPSVRGSEFLHDWMQRWRIYDDACITLDSPDGGPQPGLSVGYTDPKRSYSVADVRLFVALAPHVSRALHLTRVFCDQQLIGEHRASDAQEVGIVELDSTLHVLEANQTARRLLAANAARSHSRSDGDSHAKGRFNVRAGVAFDALLDRNAARQFRAAVAAVHAPRLGERPEAWFRIARPQTATLIAFLVAQPAAWFLDRTLRVYLLDPSRKVSAPTSAWRTLWGLTVTESRVAAGLLSGRSPAEIAAELRISANTMKSHIRNVYAKTGTHRQSALVHLLSQTLRVSSIDADTH